MPFWDRLRHVVPVRAALQGVNAAVVGILLAAWIDPLWSTSIRGTSDAVLAAAALALLVVAKAPSWLVVVLCVLGAVVLDAV
jgi:chromate transporter